MNVIEFANFLQIGNNCFHSFMLGRRQTCFSVPNSYDKHVAPMRLIKSGATAH